MAGALREVTRPLGLSLGDRAHLALGIAEGTPILTTDLAWAAVPVETPAEVLMDRMGRDSAVETPDIVVTDYASLVGCS